MKNPSFKPFILWLLGRYISMDFLKEQKMKLSKKTQEKLWATTECISDGKKKKSSRANG